MTITKVTHLVVYVNNQDDALAFYTNKLGFRLNTDAQFGEMRWLTVSPASQPDFEIVLMVPTKPESMAMVGKQSPEAPMFNVATEDCNGTCEALKQKGVVFLQEPTKQMWGTDALAVDLYGNKILIVQ